MSNNPKAHVGRVINEKYCENTFGTPAILGDNITLLGTQCRFGDKISQIPSGLSPKRGCSPKWVTGPGQSQ